MNDEHAHIDQTPDTSLLTTEQMQARIEALEQENAALKAYSLPADHRDTKWMILYNLVSKYYYKIHEKDIEDALGQLEVLDIQTPPFLFQQVMEASADYVVNRFHGELTEEGTRGQLEQEYIEFVEAADHVVASLQDTRPLSLRLNSPETLKRELIGEAFDLLVTTGGVLAYFGVQWPEIENEFRAGMDKLNNRTEKDYAWYPSVKRVVKKSKMGEQL